MRSFSSISNNFTLEKKNIRFVEEYQTLRIMTIEAYKPLIESSTTISLSSSAEALPGFASTSPAVPIAQSIGIATLSPITKLPKYLLPTYASFYSLFLVPDAVLEVNVSARVKEEVRRMINHPESMDVTIFDAAMKEVLDLLL